MSTRLLLVESDDGVRRELSALLAQSGLEIFEAREGSEALPLLQSQHGPWIVLMEWLSRDTDNEFCLDIRRRMNDADPAPYIMLMSKNVSRQDIAKGIRLGADEYLQKPLRPDFLRSRVRAASRLVDRAKAPTQRIVDALRDAVDQGSGELIVRERERVFRVLFFDKKVAFLSDSERNTSLKSALVARGIDEEDVSAAIAEARRSSMSFFDIIVAWGLCDMTDLRDWTRAWIQVGLQQLLETSSSPQLLFVPREYQADNSPVTFDLEDLLVNVSYSNEAEPRKQLVSVVPPASSRGIFRQSFFHDPAPEPATSAVLRRVMAIDGALGTAVFVRDTGRCEGWVGSPPDPDMVWSALQLLASAGKSETDPEELTLSTKDFFHIVRALAGDGQRICYLLAKRDSTNLGLCRAALARACSSDEDQS